MDMFPDTAVVREIQRELDDLIQQGVRNITRLIKATDPSITDPPSVQTQSSGHRQTGQKPRSRNYVMSSKSGKEQTDSSLTGRLVRDGLLTAEMLRQLQKEWLEDKNQESTNHSALFMDDYNVNNKGRKKKKKK